MQCVLAAFCFLMWLLLTFTQNFTGLLHMHKSLLNWPPQGLDFLSLHVKTHFSFPPRWLQSEPFLLLWSFTSLSVCTLAFPVNVCVVISAFTRYYVRVILPKSHTPILLLVIHTFSRLCESGPLLCRCKLRWQLFPPFHFHGFFSPYVTSVVCFKHSTHPQTLILT